MSEQAKFLYYNAYVLKNFMKIEWEMAEKTESKTKENNNNNIEEKHSIE